MGASFILLLLLGQEAPDLVRTFGEAGWLCAPKEFEVVAISPLARRVAATARDGRLRMWDLETRRQVLDEALPVGTRAVDAVFVDDDTVVTSGTDDTLRVWKAGEVAAAHFVGTRGRLAAGPGEGEVVVAGGTPRVVGWRDGKFRPFRFVADGRPPPGHTTCALAAGPDRLFTAHGRQILEWNGRTGDFIGSLTLVDRKVGDVEALAHDGHRLLSGHASGHVLEWSLQDRLSKVLLEPGPGRVRKVVACGPLAGGHAWAVHGSGWLRTSAPAEQYLGVVGVPAASVASGRAILAVAEASVMRPGIAEIPLGWNRSGPWSIVLHDVASGRPFRPRGGAHDRFVLEASVVGRRLVTQSPDALILWNLNSGEQLARVTDRPGAYAIDGDRLFTTSDAGLETWDLRTGERRAALAGIGPRAALLVSGTRAFLSEKANVEIRDLETGRVEAVVPCGEPVDSLRRAPGKRLIVGHFRCVSWLDPDARTAVLGTTRGFGTPAVDAEGRHVATVTDAADGCSLEVWDTQSGKAVARQALAYVPAAVSIGAGRVWAVDADGRLLRWDWKAGVLDRKTLACEPHALLPLDASRLWIGAGSSLHHVDFDAGRLGPAVSGHEGPVAGIQAVWDGSIVSYSLDRTARLWRPR